MGPHHHHEPDEANPQRSYSLPSAGARRSAWFSVRVRLSVLRRHLSAADRCDYSPQAVEAWMRDAGFVAEGDRWLVEESNLGSLHPSEVSELRPVPGDAAN